MTNKFNIGDIVEVKNQFIIIGIRKLNSTIMYTIIPVNEDIDTVYYDTIDISEKQLKGIRGKYHYGEN